MKADKYWEKKISMYLLFFIFTFFLTYYAIHPLFSSELNYIVALKTSIGTSMIFLIIILARRLSSKKQIKSIEKEKNKESIWTQISAQVILYLMALFTVYSFVIKI